jgi:hypothetical protein
MSGLPNTASVSGAEDGVEQGEHQHPRSPEHGAAGEVQDRADQDGRTERALGEGVVSAMRWSGLSMPCWPARSTLAEITVEEAAGQPAPPVDAELVAHEVVEGVDRHGDDQQAEAVLDGVPEARLVARRQRRGEFPGLLVEQHGEARLAEQQHQQGEQSLYRPSSWRQWAAMAMKRRRCVVEVFM